MADSLRRGVSGGGGGGGGGSAINLLSDSDADDVEGSGDYEEVEEGEDRSGEQGAPQLPPRVRKASEM